MNKDILNALLKVANSLDSQGIENLASRLDNVLVSLAEESWTDESYEELSPEKEEELIKTYPEDEPEAKLKEDAETSSNIYEKILLRQNLIPMRVRGESILGSGAFGTVVRALWNGRQVAVKLTRDTDELSNWEALKSLKDQLSDDTKRHVPEVYAVGTDDQTAYHFIVMELLKAPPRYLLQILYDYGKEFKPIMNVQNVLKDEGILYNATIEAAHAFSMSSKFASDVFKKLLALSLPEAERDSAKWKKAIMTLKLGITNAVRESAIENGIEATSWKVKDFTNQISKYLVHMLKPEMPSSASAYALYPQDYPAAEDAPEIASFVKALLDLGEHGLYWQDLHDENVMMRPETGELVLIDIGLYTTEDPSLY